MKKTLLLCLVIFVVFVFILFREKEHTINYKIKDKYTFEVMEKLDLNNKMENYYFEISVDNEIFNFQIFNTFNKKSKIIKKIKYVKHDDYKCIQPLLSNDEPLSDAVCKKNDIQYFYNDLDKKIPEFSKTTNKVIKNSDNLIIYDSLEKNKYLTIDTYKGIYLINKNFGYKKIDIFKNEKYTREISCIIDKYYLTANYDEKYEFNEFKLVNLKNKKIETIYSDFAISFDSYIQGIINNEVYLFDRINKKQYKININNKKVYYIGNTNGIKVYKNNEFVKENAYKAAKENITFSELSTDIKYNNKEYKFYKSYNTNSSGYFLIYKKVDNVYKVYRINVQNKKIITYLFDTTDINSIKMDNNYIYFKYKDEIKYFNDLYGVKTIIKYNELIFNDKINFYIFDK